MTLIEPLRRWANGFELLSEVVFHGACVNLFTTVPLCCCCYTMETDPVIPKPGVTEPSGNPGFFFFAKQ